MLRRAVFILGMHRSGTSLAAGLARLSGVDLGRTLLVGAAAENQRGFWEHRDVLTIDDEVFTALSLAWNVPVPLPDEWLDHPRVLPLATRAAELLARDFSAAPLWGIKDPRLCRLWPLWERAASHLVDEIHFLHVFRHPLEVADSLWARNRIPTEQALLAWLFHNLEVVQPLAGSRLASVPFRRLVEDAPVIVAGLRARLGETTPLTAATEREIAEFVGPALVHHRAAEDDPRLDTEVGRLAVACHAGLERLAAGDSTAGSELEGIAAGLRDLVSSRRGGRRRKTATVDVIVPVYRGQDATLACLDAVRAAGGDFELVVIDDASPEPDLVALLKARAAGGEFTLLENESNLGFVASANRGMKLHPDRDVVLLNADTIVPPGWLDRLQAAAAGDFVGTVTPFSNNATLASYPAPFANNPLPEGWTAFELDRLFRDVNPAWHIDVPTAVGFCMYLCRDCLEDVGPFDETFFRRGYGEETDFSMRAASRGWRNVLAADVFVFHEGRVSFGAEAGVLQRRAAQIMRRRHPSYEAAISRFRHDDPLAAARDAVSVARVDWRGAAELRRVFDERRRVEADRRADLESEVEAIRREAAELTAGLATAQRLANKRLEQIRVLDLGLAEASRLAGERLEQIRTLDEALAEASRLARERLEQVRTLDAALAEASRLAEERLEQVRASEAAHAAAARLAVERLSAIEALDRQVGVTASALAAAEHIALDRLAQVEELTRRVEALQAGALTAEGLRLA